MDVSSCGKTVTGSKLIEVRMPSLCMNLVLLSRDALRRSPTSTRFSISCRRCCCSITISAEEASTHVENDAVKADKETAEPEESCPNDGGGSLLPILGRQSRRILQRCPFECRRTSISSSVLDPTLYETHKALEYSVALWAIGRWIRHRRRGHCHLKLELRRPRGWHFQVPGSSFVGLGQPHARYEFSMWVLYFVVFSPHFNQFAYIDASGVPTGPAHLSLSRSFPPSHPSHWVLSRFSAPWLPFISAGPWLELEGKCEPWTFE